jgi:transmembrane sensor
MLIARAGWQVSRPGGLRSDAPGKRYGSDPQLRELLGIPKTYRTAHGEQRVERLPDGSLLRLDTDSEATVRYSGREPEIKRGQALLEVVHDSQRRFRVAAGEAGAIAAGTQFDV